MFDRFGRVSYCPHTKVAEFVHHLEQGRLTASRCMECGHLSFPPRADCPACRSDGFEFVELSGRGTVLTYSRIAVPPAGFESQAPYTLGVVDLEETGRLLACCGETLEGDDLVIGMDVQVVPRLIAVNGEAKVDYTLERPQPKRS